MLIPVFDDRELAEYDEEYDNKHTHTNEYVDNNGRKHRIYIYQDYRSVDGYLADDGFDFDEVVYRNDYDYYFDTKSDLHPILVKKNKKTGEYLLYSPVLDSNNITNSEKRWFTPDKYAPELIDKVSNYDFNDLSLIKNFKKVIEFIDNEYYDMISFVNEHKEEDLLGYIEASDSKDEFI